ncbi:trimeric intracellular cation channel family protein [Fulvivirga sediminis]|uniref:Trimeric intracellular cation channel family protein n=1 Tax=Fulvivirga sediminis TaxID=2803949 RepID=A0A937FBT0_9BACT|nr:trimeric intracellular cation channel family protein [Fulvivirga sediminis]MBL3657975.1 trimeric intracellular cation channel family protein [Fulvivirga sediminis]
MNLLYALDIIGTFVFAISGIRLAAKKDMDIFGATVIGFVTAVGGGTTRDVLLGSYPITWVHDLNYAIVILLALPFTFIFRKYIVNMHRTFFVFDTVGIALFTISGMQKTLNLGINEGLAITMGMVSAVVGGVIRDMLCNEIPLIFRKEIYATACLIGALVFFLLDKYQIFSQNINYIATVLAIIVIRIVAIKYNLSLPKMKA